MISMTTDKKSEASSPSNATATGSTPAASSSSARVAPSSSTKTKLSLRSSLTKPASSRQQRAKRAKVSFSQEVISKDDNGGDGSKVVIKEEHGIFLGPLLGRMTMSSSDTETEDEGDNAKDGSAAAKTASAPVISFAMDGNTSENLSYSESSNGILKSSNNGSSQLLGDGNVEYDNLVVHMGLLKCGHRYRVVIPVPDYWKQNNASEGANTANALGRDDDTEEIQATKTNESYAMNVRIVEESLDNDLRGEIQKEFINNRSAEDAGPANRHHVSITLSARQQRGQYRGRFVLELTRIDDDRKHPSKSEPPSSTAEEAKSKSTVAEALPSKKCLMSLQVDATIMGKDMGTPKLRNGVVCLGKMVGYDSDDETEWQGFD